MAALGIVGFAFGSAANLRTALQSVRQRCERFSDNEKGFNDAIDELARITENLKEIEQAINRGPREDKRGYVDRNLKAVNKRLVASQKIVEKLGKGSMQLHSGPSCAHFSGICSRITRANRIHDTLSNVSTNFRDIDGLLDGVAQLVGIAELSRTGSGGVDRHLDVSSVPILTHQEVLNFDVKDKGGNLTPEAQLKMHVLDEQSEKIVAAAGSKVQSVYGMAGVGKTVALKGLGRDNQIREAFEMIHYITLGHDAADDTVVSELARIVEMSGGDRQSCTVRGCKDVNEAVLHTSQWFHGRKCLFLVDDMWKTSQSNFGYLPALRQLLSTSQGSRMAITTRDRNIAGEAGQAVEFGSRGTATSRKILLSYFDSGALDASSGEGRGDESIDKILSICNGVPLVLAVAGRGARAMKEVGRSDRAALDAYADMLGQQQMNILDESAPKYGKDNKSQTLRAAMEISLEHLNTRRKSAEIEYGMDIAKMYRALGVLKAQAWAPLSMLSKLWNVNRGDATRIMEQLCTMSLATWEEKTYKTSSSNVEKKESGLEIHDLQLEYCRQHCKELRSLHGKLLDRYLEVAVEESRTQESDADVGRDGIEDELLYAEPRPWWSESVAKDGYLHAHVAWHLVKAEKRDELRGLLVDALWIKLRLVIGGIVTLENDFAELLRMDVRADCANQGLRTESIDSEFRAILNAVRCSWHYVTQNERELAVQLGGRLFNVQERSTAARNLVESAVQNSEKPFAEARDAFLPDARSGQVNEVELWHPSSLSYSSCGKYIAVAAGKDVAAAGKDVVVVEANTLVEKIRFTGHKDSVSSVFFLPQSLKIVSGSSDGTVRLWDLEKPDANALTLRKHGDEMCSVCASADGSRVAVGCRDGTIKLWNMQEESMQGEETRRRSKWMSWFCCSVDGTNGNKEVNAADYGCIVLRGHTGWVSCVCFSPDGALLASASWDGTVRLWNAYTGEHTGVTFEGHKGVVSCVAFSPDGERVASGSEDGTIRLWRADTGAGTGILIDGHSGSVLSVAFGADGARIVSASVDKTVRVWSAESGEAIGAALKGHTSFVTSAAFSPDSARVASVSYDCTLRIWEPDRASDVSAAGEARASSATCAAISADSTRAAVGHDDGTMCIWDMQSGRTVGGPLEAHTHGVTCVAFSPDGALLAAGSRDDGAICIWDTQSGRTVGEPLEGQTDGVTCVALSPDGALLAAGLRDRTVRLWNVRSRAVVGGALEGHKQEIYKILFSADGTKLLAYSYDNYRCLWSLPSGTLLWMSHRSSEDVPNVMSDADAQTAVETIESARRPDASYKTAPVYYDLRQSAVMMKREEGDVRLATIPSIMWCELEGVWRYIADRSEFVAVLTDGRRACLTLHV